MHSEFVGSYRFGVLSIIKASVFFTYLFWHHLFFQSDQPANLLTDL